MSPTDIDGICRRQRRSLTDVAESSPGKWCKSAGSSIVGEVLAAQAAWSCATSLLLVSV
jgi:hypothetical protein